MEITVQRVLHALLVGVVAGVVAALIVWLISVLTPLHLDPGFWGLIVGVIAGLYDLLTGKSLV